MIALIDAFTPAIRRKNISLDKWLRLRSRYIQNDCLSGTHYQAIQNQVTLRTRWWKSCRNLSVESMRRVSAGMAYVPIKCLRSRHRMKKFRRFSILQLILYSFIFMNPSDLAIVRIARTFTMITMRSLCRLEVRCVCLHLPLAELTRCCRKYYRFLTQILSLPYCTGTGSSVLLRTTLTFLRRKLRMGDFRLNSYTDDDSLKHIRFPPIMTGTVERPSGVPFRAVYTFDRPIPSIFSHFRRGWPEVVSRPDAG